MVNKLIIHNSKIFGELDQEQQKYWFDFKRSKFLHNIDTFYYSVKLMEDFTDDSTDLSVHKFRKFFANRQTVLDRSYGEGVPVYFRSADHLNDLILRPCTFARFFTICLSCAEWFDIFIAPL